MAVKNVEDQLQGRTIESAVVEGGSDVLLTLHFTDGTTLEVGVDDTRRTSEERSGDEDGTARTVIGLAIYISFHPVN